MIPGPQILTTVHNGSKYTHFNIKPFMASIYGAKPENIVKVELTVADDQTIPPLPQDDPKVNVNDYWGWWDFKDKAFTFVWSKRFLLEMCFTYGIKAAEEKNKGKAYRVNVKPI